MHVRTYVCMYVYVCYTPRLHCSDSAVWLQVARQEGEYLARLLKQHNPEPHSQGKQALLQPQKPFKYTHLGSLAYVGADKAVMDIPKMGPVTGWTAGTPLQC